MESKEIQQIVFNTAKKAGLNDVQAKIIVAQSIHESGNYTSHVFKTDNNIFGMKIPAKRSKQFIERPSTIVMQSEGSTPYAHYATIQDSVNDLILSWHTYNRTDWNKIYTPELYAAYLKSRGYYGDSQSNYTNALVKYFKNVQWLKYTTPVLLFLVFGILIFTLIKK